MAGKSQGTTFSLLLFSYHLFGIGSLGLFGPVYHTLILFFGDRRQEIILFLILLQS